MGETGIHVHTTLHLYGALLMHFASNKEIYVAADMFLYYEEGNPRLCKTPDVMVIKAVDGSYERRSFKTWEEGAVPSVIFEITSKSTWVEDLVTKSSTYARLGVQEYFIFDPLEEYLDETLQGFYLEGYEYLPLAPGSDGMLFSAQLGLKMRREEAFLRFVVPETGESVLSYDEALIAAKEQAEQARLAAQRAEQESQRANEAEAEVARLRKLLAQHQEDESR